jgi:undecaprenyl-phosphate 4-deoxy-4-formamido-L-arabinose transferase
MPSLSIVIPVYKSQGSVHLVVEKLNAILPTLTPQYEIVLVDDGSPDNSWAVLQSLSQQYPHVHSIRLMRNFGQHNALLCGIRAAQHEVCITMDDDLQHPPEKISELLQALQTADVVYGYPDEEQYNSLMRKLATQVTKYVLQGAMGRDNAQHIAPFRAFRTQIRVAFAEFRGHYVNIDVLLTWGTTRFNRIPVHYNRRTIGTSNYTFAKLVTHTLNLITGFSTLPLQLASLMGFGLTAFGAILLFYIIVIRILIFGYDVPGFTFIASMISIFAGAQLFILGIIGEYLARIHFRVMDKPTFVIKDDSQQTPK